MARNFRRHRTSHPIADLNVTNLIDLGFMLLIIFMIATPLIQQEQSVQVNLPTVAKAAQPKVDPKDRFVAVAVDAKGFFVDNSTTPLTLTQLRSKLNGYATESKPPVIRIRGDAKVYYEKVAQVITEVMKSGLSRVTFDSQIEP
jgi:biopolymer transport protein TolR